MVPGTTFQTFGTYRTFWCEVPCDRELRRHHCRMVKDDRCSISLDGLYPSI